MDVSRFPDDKDNPSGDDGDIWIPEMRVKKMQFDKITEEEQCWLDSGPTSSVSHYNHCVRESQTFLNILSRESIFSYLTSTTTMILTTTMMSTAPQSFVTNFIHTLVFVILFKVLMPGLGAKGEFFVFVKVPGKVLEIVYF